MLKSYLFDLVLVKKRKKKIRCTLLKNRFRFLKNLILLWVVFHKIIAETSAFDLFQLKKHPTRSILKKTRYVLWKMSFFCGWYSIKLCLKSHRYPFFRLKITKKTRCTLHKYRYVLKKMLFYCGLFSLNFWLKSHLLTFFWSKYTHNITMYLSKIPLRFVKIVVL